MSHLEPLASLAELAQRLGFTPEGAQGTRAEALLEDASTLIRDEAGRDFENEAPPDRIVQITIEVARRAFINPEALGQLALGDANRSFDRTRVHGGDAVYLTESEKRAIRRAANRSTFKALTLVSPYDASQQTADELPLS